MFADFSFGLVVIESELDSGRDVFGLLHAGPPMPNEIPMGEMAKADQENERWITLKPHGEDEGGYVHVKIRVGGDGTAHIIQGPGELRALKLTRLASPEELATRKKLRDQARKEKQKKLAEQQKQQEQQDLERSSQDPEYAQKQAQEKLRLQQEKEEADHKRQELLGKITELHKTLLTQAGEVAGDDLYTKFADILPDAASQDDYKDSVKSGIRKKMAAELGIDPSEAPDHLKDELQAASGAGGIIAGHNLRRISGGLKKLRKNLIGEMIKDADLKGAVLGEDASVDSSEKVTPTGAPGYKRQAGRQAAEQGFTPQDAKREATQAFQDRVSQIAAMGEDKRAEAIVEARKGTIKRMGYVSELSSDDPTADGSTPNIPKPVSELKPQQIKEKAEKVRAFLQTHDQLEQLQRELRKLTQKGDPDSTEEETSALDKLDSAAPTGADLGLEIGAVEPEFAKKLEQEIQDAVKEDLTRSFLQAVDEDASHVGYADNLIRKAMMAHIGVGAHAHLANTVLSLTGSEGIDRQVVDVLGIEAAAQLAAHQIQRDSGPETLQSVRQGLSRYHDEQSLQKMQEAMETAQAARADAAEIELPPIQNTTDAALVAELNRERKAKIAEAHEALGTALGAVEAGAALNLALGKKKNSLTVDFGREANTQQIILNLRALGLQDGDYHVQKTVGDSGQADDNRLVVTLTKSGMDRLTQPLDPKSRENAEYVRQLKSGQLDEADFLPAGFMQRAQSDWNENPPFPTNFAQAGDFSDVERGVLDAVASRLADGWKPSEIFRYMMDTASQQVPEGKEAEFSQHVTRLFPFVKTTQKVNQHGEAYTHHEAVDLDKDPEIQKGLDQMRQQWLAENHPGKPDFHSQTLTDTPQAREALFRVLSHKPALLAAFRDPSDLGGTEENRRHAAAIKNYFFQTLAKGKLRGKTAREHDAQVVQERRAALEKLGPSPVKWGGQEDSLFGGPSEPQNEITFTPTSSPEARQQALSAWGLKPGMYTFDGDKCTLTQEGMEHVMPSEGTDDVISGGLGGLNPQWVQHQRKAQAIKSKFQTTGDMWGEFKETMRGTRNAYQAVQEVMQNELIKEFHHQHAHLIGAPMRLSKQTTDHWERRLSVTDPDKAREIRQRDMDLMNELRERDSSGRYLDMGEGGLVTAVQKRLENQNRQKQLQGGFGWDLFGAQGGGEAETQDTHSLTPDAHERLTLGRHAEGALKQMLAQDYGLNPTDGHIHLLHDLSWGKGTKHVGKQRTMKMLLKTGRVLGFAGAGSGKTGMQIGGFTQAHAEGKAKKGFFVVPSIVRNQFGEAMCQFTEPGKYKWHAQTDDLAGRLDAYTDPNTHMVVTTHATFRDDMMKAMSIHTGMDVDRTREKFMQASRPERAQMLKAALDHHGIPSDYLAVDEAHDFLNRAGKGDSLQSMVLEAALDNSKYKSLWTGSPVKNDPSEVFDWLAKVDPERFPDRDSFLRRYGVNTLGSKEALQRLMDQYAYIDAVKADVKKSITWGKRDPDGNARPIPLTPHQQVAYQQVHDAFNRASRAQRDGLIDVEACKTLSPKSFEGAEEEEHQRIASSLQAALGTAKFSALNRVVNEFPAEHNAKVQHVLQLTGERRGKGGVIFARNKASIQMLKAELEKQGHKVGIINGESSTDEKGRVRKQFDSGDVDIVLCSDAGATGANLQHRGEYLINYDLPLTQKTLEQRNARIDRLGQKRPIELHHLQTDTQVDQDNYKRLHRKRLLGEILQGEFRSLEDTGLASYLHLAHAEHKGDGIEDNSPQAAD